ncbi:hypothetical protein IP90_02254 [Luteimonas cucumeris]|uniref:Uncharacterized protein n=1 Tax=Luteimonas cucumeris TaxID=985012 RepID=A0A562L234_9GAMM|nr:hypothetical protein [Luteimonas cucumeris]TWI01695.1 hypothetical protein IP90_02254 [Luteimonas cucumeris]
MSKRDPVTFDVTPVWKQVTAELKTELLAFWKHNHAIGDPTRAEARANEAVCIARGGDGALCAVSTAVIRVLPRLRQPMYYYRLFFSTAVRGQDQVIPFYNRAREVLQAYNASLPAPESLGVLLELESGYLGAYYKQAYVPEADSTFIGYSPRGLQLRVSYFEGARLMAPTPLRQAVMQRR